MGIELNIRITSPMDQDDRDLLSGVAVMTLAIANHEMAKERFPETFGDDDDTTAKAEAPAPCAALDPADGSGICVSVAGHRGRHTFRRLEPSSISN